MNNLDTTEAYLLDGLELRVGRNSEIYVLSERDKSIVRPQVGDIWFTTDPASPFSNKRNGDCRLFVIAKIEESVDGIYGNLSIRDAALGYGSYLELSKILFEDKVIVYTYDEFVRMVVHGNMDVSRNTSHRFKQKGILTLRAPEGYIKMTYKD